MKFVPNFISIKCAKLAKSLKVKKQSICRSATVIKIKGQFNNLIDSLCEKIANKFKFHYIYRCRVQSLGHWGIWHASCENHTLGRFCEEHALEERRDYHAYKAISVNYFISEHPVGSEEYNRGLALAAINEFYLRVMYKNKFKYPRCEGHEQWLNHLERKFVSYYRLSGDEIIDLQVEEDQQIAAQQLIDEENEIWEQQQEEQQLLDDDPDEDFDVIEVIDPDEDFDVIEVIDPDEGFEDMEAIDPNEGPDENWDNLDDEPDEGFVE